MLLDLEQEQRRRNRGKSCLRARRTEIGKSYTDTMQGANDNSRSRKSPRGKSAPNKPTVPLFRQEAPHAVASGYTSRAHTRIPCSSSEPTTL